MKARTRKRRPALRVLTVVLVAAVAAVVAAPAATAAFGQDALNGRSERHAARFATAAQSHVQRKVIVKFGDPVVVGPDERVQTIVSIGGDVKIAGTVDESVIVVGGDVLLQPSADVGGKMKDQDATIVVVNGELTRQTGAVVRGNVETVEVGNLGDVLGWARENAGWSALKPIGSFVGWLVGTVIILLLGLLAAAIMPGQIRAVERQVARRPGASLGWGSLTVLLIVPLSIVLLLVTVIGIIPAVGVLIVLPFFTVFVVTAVAVFVVERLFGARLKGNLMGAVAIGSVATSTVVQIPFLGFVVLVAMTFIGTGATLIAWNAWRRERRLLREGGAPAGGPGGAPQGPPAPTPGGQPAVGQPPYVPPPSAQQPYAQPPYLLPPIAQAPVGTQAYLHPQYGWVVYGPPSEAQTAAQPAVAAPETEVSPSEAAPDTAAESPNDEVE